MYRRISAVICGAAAFVSLLALTSAVAAAACVRDVALWDTLRVRTGPGAHFAEVGRIPPTACGVVVRGACRGGWCPVAFGRAAGWSNARFLAPSAVQAARRPAFGTGPARTSVCVRGLPPRQTLKVRDTPSPAGGLLYGFHNGSCGVSITGSCTGGYCPVEYRGYRGWADSRYLR